MGMNLCDTDKAKSAHKLELWVIWDTGCRRPRRLICATVRHGRRLALAKRRLESGVQDWCGAGGLPHCYRDSFGSAMRVLGILFATILSRKCS